MLNRFTRTFSTVPTSLATVSVACVLIPSAASAVLAQPSPLDDCPLELVPGTPAATLDFGYSIAVSESGGLVAIGDPSGGDDGVVHLFNTSTLSTVVIQPSNSGCSTESIGFGSSLAFNESGDRLVVGAPGYCQIDDSTTRGLAFVVDLQSPGFPQTEFSPADPNLKRFGESLAVSGDRIIISAPRTNRGAEDLGQVYAFDFSGSQPTLLGTFLPSAFDVNNLGRSIAIDGNLVAIGATGTKVSSGDDAEDAVFFFDGFTQVGVFATPVISDIQFGTNEFGVAIGVSGNRIFVTDPELSLVATQGSDNAYYEYSYSNGSIQQVAGPILLDPFFGSSFGDALAIDGDTLVISNRLRSAGLGDAVVIDISDPNQTQRRLLDTFSGDDPSGFTISMDVDGGSIAVGRIDEVNPYGMLFDLAQTGCNLADLAPPYCVLDLSDHNAFTSAFTAGDLSVDFAPPYGILDLNDITEWVTAFTAGCP